MLFVGLGTYLLIGGGVEWTMDASLVGLTNLSNGEQEEVAKRNPELKQEFIVCLQQQLIILMGGYTRTNYGNETEFSSVEIFGQEEGKRELWKGDNQLLYCPSSHVSTLK